MIQAMTTTDAVAERKQWLAERKKRLGATDISAIVSINPYRTGYEVWLEKRGLLNEWEGNETTELGRRLEPAILDEAEHRWGELERNVVAHAEGLPIASTLDGLIVKDNVPVEVKTAGMTNEFAELGHWGEPGSDEIPDWYLVQCHTQLLCTGADLCRMLALIAGRGIVEYEIARDQSVCDAIAYRGAEWWEKHIVKGIEPERSPAPSIEILKRIRREPESVTDLATDSLGLVEQWEAAKAKAKAADKEADEIKRQVMLTLGTSEAGRLPDGRMLTFLEQTKKEFVSKEVTFRVLRIKKGGK